MPGLSVKRYLTINRADIGTAAAIRITSDGAEGNAPGYMAWEVEMLGPSRLVVARDDKHRAPGQPSRAAWIETEGIIITTVRVPDSDPPLWRQELFYPWQALT